MKVTFISDTHTKHREVTRDLPGGDILIHSGDCMNTGKFKFELTGFLDWFSRLDQYTHKVFIAGNHDWFFEKREDEVEEVLKQYPNVTYLQDQNINIEGLNIYGSPWQPEFFNWAFNIPRNSPRMEEIWNRIPEDTDILVTHGPPFSILDYVYWSRQNAGCEVLFERVFEVKPLLHIFGHIHNAGYREVDGVHFVNASVLDEDYEYAFPPLTVEINTETKKVTIV